LIDVRRLTSVDEPPPDDFDVLGQSVAELPGWAEAMAEVEATGHWSDMDWPGPLRASAGAPS
jgi:hypothetical protein